MHKGFLSTFTVLSVVFALLTLSAPSFAQRRGLSRRPAYTKAEVDRVIHRVENRSDIFVRLFDKALDRSGLDGSDREDRLNERAEDLEKELDKVRKEFDSAEGYLEVREHVVRALNVSEAINDTVRARRLNPEVERQWVLLKAELNKLARVYNIRPLR